MALAQLSAHEPQLKPHELVPQVRPKAVHEAASQPEHCPLPQVELAELRVQSKQELPAMPQLVLALPGRHWPPALQPAQQVPPRQTPAAPLVEHDELAAIGACVHTAWQPLPSTPSVVQLFWSSQSP